MGALAQIAGGQGDKSPEFELGTLMQIAPRIFKNAD